MNLELAGLLRHAVQSHLSPKLFFFFFFLKTSLAVRDHLTTWKAKVMTLILDPPLLSVWYPVLIKDVHCQLKGFNFHVLLSVWLEKK